MSRHPLRPAGVALGLLLALAAAVPTVALATTAGPVVLGPHAAPAEPTEPPPDRLPPGTLGQIPQDYELHAELILVSGQLQGFKEHCDFGRSPDRDEMLGWYRHYDLARSMTRIEAIYDLGVALGLEAPCTTAHYTALAAHWDRLLIRTQTYVEAYRRE